MIQANNLSKAYANHPVLIDFSIALPTRGIICLSGPSGCGKTTFLRILAGLEIPDKGSVQGLEDLRLSMVFQEDRLLPWLTVAGNIAAVQPEPTVVRYYLSCMELNEKANQYPMSLSGGMRRRLALARALAYGGDIFLLDEPLKGLDNQLKERIYPHLLDLKKNSLVIMASHDSSEITALADQVYQLKGPPLKII
jgi:ABC-type nitrate/sulfonate/bicarbonate transport system ATPase subunit